MRIFILTALFIFALFAKEIPNHSTIFVYHHVSDKTPKSTSISPKLFEEHLKYLIKNNYKIWSLEKILNQLTYNKTIPKKTVAITFDDAYKSIYTKAYIILKKYKAPFTVFINTSTINNASNLYLTWNELKKMQPLINYGSHSHYHKFLIRKEKKFIRDDLRKAHNILKEKLNSKIKMFAYPFGESNKKIQDVLKEFDYYGLTQESGSIDKYLQKLKIPRFPLNNFYGEMQRFKSLLHMKPLNIENVKPIKRVFKEKELKNQTLNFTIKKTNDISVKQVSCFDSLGTPLEKTIYKKNQKFEIEVKLPAWKMGRQKINCTAPSKTLKDTFYWNSELFFIKSNKNEWYKP